MWIKEEVTSIQLADRLWSGAVDTWKQILEADKEDEAMSYMEDLFCCGEDGAHWELVPRPGTCALLRAFHCSKPTPQHQ